jgi:hypothetical protein
MINQTSKANAGALPFSSLAPQGPEGLFKEADIDCMDAVIDPSGPPPSLPKAQRSCPYAQQSVRCGPYVRG